MMEMLFVNSFRFLHVFMYWLLYLFVIIVSRRIV